MVIMSATFLISSVHKRFDIAIKSAELNVADFKISCDVISALYLSLKARDQFNTNH